MKRHFGFVAIVLATVLFNRLPTAQAKPPSAGKAPEATRVPNSVGPVPVSPVMRRVFSIWLLLFVANAHFAVRAAEPDAAGIEFFEKQIRPVLIKYCYECHSADAKTLKGGLRLDSRDAVLRGGESGTVIVAGKPNDSLLLKALRYDDVEMPPTGKLSDEVIADFRKWIELGAPDPRVESASPTPATGASKIDIAAGKKFWAFQSPQRHQQPSVKQPHWIVTPIDGFVLAKLDEASLSPSAPADRRTLIRRVTFDLIGLPPTPEEVEAFVADSSPDAYEQLAERLLASPHYGERWARMWLDTAKIRLIRLPRGCIRMGIVTATGLSRR